MTIYLVKDTSVNVILLHGRYHAQSRPWQNQDIPRLTSFKNPGPYLRRTMVLAEFSISPTVLRSKGNTASKLQK